MQQDAIKNDFSSSPLRSSDEPSSSPGQDHVDSSEQIPNDGADNSVLDSPSYNAIIVEDNTEKRHTSSDYVSKKPKWWKRIAGRRGTPGQRKAISRMTERGYVLSSSKLLIGKHRHHLSVCKLFAHRPNGKPICIEDMLVTGAHHESETCHDNHDNTDHYVCLEIGFGQGEVLLANASKFPERCYIGSEIHQPGIGNALLRMERAIDQEMMISSPSASSIPNETQTTHIYENVRIYPGDGVKLIGMLPSMSLNAVYLTFPDPWPKEDDHGWRVIQDESVHAIGRVLKPGGCFYLATDAACFYDWTMHIFQRVSSVEKCEEMIPNANSNANVTNTVQWEQVLPCPDRAEWLPVVSKYEEKGIAEGRHTMFQCWRRV